MDCKYVRDSSCLCYCFHPGSSSLFYLTNTKNRLRIIEENLYTGLVKHQFSVPLKQQSLNTDNYILNYAPDTREVILTLANQILVYSLQLKILTFVGQAYQNKNPCFIQRATYKKGTLFFSAADHYMLFGIRLADCIKAGTISHYTKYKMAEVKTSAIAVGANKLVTLCSDSHLRVWDIETATVLKGIALDSRTGEPVCMSFSKEAEHLLVGTNNGVVLAYDAASLGEKNINLLNKQVGKERIQSISWFHYSGQAQSRRFLTLTKDGNVKLYSFYFEKVKQSRESREKYMGRANELSLLYIIKSHIQPHFQIRSHQYANFIYFHPGVLLYMVDYYPRMYYPVITSQYAHSFESLVPKKKEVYFQGNFLYLDGLTLKRLRNEPQSKMSLDSVLEFKGLKILKMDFRPKFAVLEQLPLEIVKGVPVSKLRFKVMVTYYLDNMIRCLLLSNIVLTGSNDVIDNLKEYSGHAFHFIGPQSNLSPLLMILQEDRQTITVLNETPIQDTSYYLQEERPYLKQTGELYSKQLKIKIQKIFQTPFRNSYVVLYLSQNLIRFSNNIHIHSDLLDYDVYMNLGLRMDYTDIIIDVVWTSRGQIGAVVCLQKVVLINDELKIIKSVPIEGYVIQGQFIGYTLVITTKVDVQYVDVSGNPLQLYCIQNYQSKYLILGILCDRIIGIERFQGQINCKMRYFNLMQPLVSGYINYYQLQNAPINAFTLKTIIQGLSPYHSVSEELLVLLNKNSLCNFSRYFIESNVKLYSRSIRAATLNSEVRIERFIANKVWLQHKNTILDYLLYYDDLKDSSDNYEVQKSKEYENLLIKLIGAESLYSIKQVIKEEQAKAIERPSIVNSFGEQSLFQLYYDFSEKENIFVKMQLLPFKANDDREWIGVNGMYFQSKIGDNNDQVDVNAVQAEGEEEAEGREADPDNPAQEEGEFAALIVYYRFDDGKGELVDDLSDFHNQALVEGEPWNLLDDNDPLELEDKWGKKCPPQYSIKGSIVRREKKIGSKPGKTFTFQLWIRAQQTSFKLLQLGQKFEFGMQNGTFYYKGDKLELLKGKASQDYDYLPGVWTNITFVYSSKESKIVLYLNSFPWYEGRGQANFNRNGLQIGSQDFEGQFTEFRLWRKQLPLTDIKEYLRSPLELVAQKRKMMKMKMRERKKKRQKKQGEEAFFPTIEL